MAAVEASVAFMQVFNGPLVHLLSSNRWLDRGSTFRSNSEENITETDA